MHASRSSWRSVPALVSQAGCANCHGTGWELFDVAGKSQARRCSCFVLDRMLKLKEQVYIPHQYQHCNFGNFRPGTSSQFRALAEARRFAERFPLVSRGLFLTGEPMSGKTHLAVAILRELFHRFQDDILFASFDDLVSFYSSARRRQEQRTHWERLKSVSLLVLDGLGLSRCSGEAVELTQELIHARAGIKRKTIYTGGSVHCQALFGQKRSESSHFSETQELLASLPTHTSMCLFTDVRTLKVQGDPGVNGSRRKKLFVIPGF
jgi:DNA replication protein DnaC